MKSWKLRGLVTFGENFLFLYIQLNIYDTCYGLLYIFLNRITLPIYKISFIATLKILGYAAFRKLPSYNHLQMLGRNEEKNIHR